MTLFFAFGLLLVWLFQDHVVSLADQTPKQPGQQACLQLCQPAKSHCEEKEGVLKTFHMTPMWIETHASYIDSARSTTTLQMTFNAGSVQDAALLKIPLISAGQVDDSEPLTVEMTVANDISIGNGIDSDIRYGVSDGIRFVGFETCDKGNYGVNSPCYGLAGVSGPTVSSMKYSPVTSKPSDSFYPGQFVFTLKLNDRWGSCYTAHDGGFTTQTGYDHRPLLSKGLVLEMYKSDAGERVGIKYIKVVITKDA